MKGRNLFVAGLVVVVVLALTLSGLALARSSHDDVQGLVTSSSGTNSNLLAVSGDQQTGLSVSGTGDVYAKPDIALISLGVQGEAKTVAEAQQQANEAMSAIMAALSAKGVAVKDIQTTSYSIQPIYEYPPKLDGTTQRTLVGYQVSNIVTVTVRNVDNAGAIIDAVTAAGGDLTIVNNISFTVEDPKPYTDQARQLAIQDAIAKAKQMASVAGVNLGKLINISESGGYVPTPVAYRDSAVSGATSISSGQLEISVSVQLVYTLE